MSNELMKNIVKHFGEHSPESFLNADLNDFMQIKGLGKTRANLIFSIKEHCNNLYKNQLPDKYVICSPESAANYLMNRMRFLKQEHFICLYLNIKNQILAEETIYIGSLNSSIVHPREVFKHAIRVSAASIVCFHNHPSGSPVPSQEDIDVTKRLVEAGKLIGISVVDHLIIGDKVYTSLKDKGHI